MSQNSLEKVFYVKVFFDQFNVPQQKKAQLKKLISIIFKELQDKLAKKLYDDFRKDNKDVSEIAEKNTLKKENVQKCKESQLNIKDLILILCRFKDGISTKDNLEWLRHEFGEQASESKNNADYRDSHNYAQSRYNGDPWIEEWDNRS